MPATIELWTDGACSGNPGPGGWAAILVARGPDGGLAKQVELSGADPATTNNRMELQAVVSGLRALERPVQLTVHTDSSYVMDAIVKAWHVGWVKRGWKTAAKQPVKNRDLWEELLVLVARHTITWHKVKGHAGVALNERCDELAVAACHGARRAPAPTAAAAALSCGA
ncbi:MAG: ribonuclease [Solirubrobacteraceae bacterium]|nr:ribonuclease [Solirubrobacteraceae bacterium]